MKKYQENNKDYTKFNVSKKEAKTQTQTHAHAHTLADSDKSAIFILRVNSSPRLYPTELTGFVIGANNATPLYFLLPHKQIA